MGGRDPDQPVGDPGPYQQMGGTYQKSLDAKMTEKTYKKPTVTSPIEIPEPTKPPPTAKTAKSTVEDTKKPTVSSGQITEPPLSKKAAKSPEASYSITSKPEEPHGARTNQMKTVGGSEDDKTVIETMQDEITELKAKMMEVESNHSTLLARLMELETKFSSVETAEVSDPGVATEAAPVAVEETTDTDDALTGRAIEVIPDPFGQKSDGTKAPNMPGATARTVDKPKSVEPCANAANASMTCYKASKMARTRTDPPEVVREVSKKEDVTKATTKDIEPVVMFNKEQNMKETKKPPEKVAKNQSTQVQCVQTIWTRKLDEIELGEYDEFYESTTKAKNNPMTKTHFNAEGKVTFKPLLLIPNSTHSDQSNKSGQAAENIVLYVRRG